MTLWGPAMEAEIEYRQSEVRKAWGGRPQRGADRSDRTTERRADRARSSSTQPDRIEQIRAGISGMRPGRATHKGLPA